jgi:hypothetical protein
MPQESKKSNSTHRRGYAVLPFVMGSARGTHYSFLSLPNHKSERLSITLCTQPRSEKWNKAWALAAFRAEHALILNEIRCGLFHTSSRRSGT